VDGSRKERSWQPAVRLTKLPAGRTITRL
jgi:hypothetical protein